MWTIDELKRVGKTAMKANYWRSVAAALLLALLTHGLRVSSRTGGSDQQAGEEFTQTLNGVPQTQAMLIAMIFAGIGVTALVIALILRIFIFNPLQVGCYAFFEENIRSEGQTDLGMVTTGFGNYGHTFVTLFLRDLYILLWCLLLLIPGIIKAYSYRFVPFILREHPELSASEILQRSKAMMEGHKMEAFKFDLSFIGWYILGVITYGLVDIFWTEPYRQNANAAMYLALKEGN